MAYFGDLSEIINGGTGGNSGAPQTISFSKWARIAAVAAPALQARKYHSMWLYDGVPSGGAAPGAVAAPDNATAGGLKQTDPAGGRQKWLFGGGAAATTQGVLVIYDRLLHIGGLSGTGAGAQTVGGSLTRYTDGVGNVAWAEIYTQIGSTATTITMSYTDPVNGAGRTSVATAFGGTANRDVSRLVPLPLASGDTGVSAVASVTLAASTLTAGNFGVTVARPLLTIPMFGNTGIRDLLAGLPPIAEIQTDACLAAIWYSHTAVAPDVHGFVSMAER